MTNRYIGLLCRVWGYLSPRRRGQFLLLVGISTLSGFTEMVGLGVIFPFLSVLVSPEKVMENQTAGKIMEFLGVGTKNDLLFYLTLVLIVVTLLSCAVRMLLTWASARVSFMAAGDLSVEMYRRTLFQPYAVHIARNSSEIISGIGVKVSHSVSFLHQTSTLINSAIVLTALTITLVAISPLAAATSCVFFSVAYVSISIFVKKRLRQNGAVLSAEAPQIVKALQEGLGGIRNVLLAGSQSYYCAFYTDSDSRIRRAQSANAFINVTPRYLMEGFGVTAIALLAYWMTLYDSVGPQGALPVLGAFALGAQRMLPTFQAIYGAWANIVSSEASVLDTLALLDQPLPDEAFKPKPASLELTGDIRLQSIDFAYQSEGPFILRQLDLTVLKGERIGIVGPTGCGKSTLLDILMGLLQPMRGRLLVDGVPITEENRPAWRQSIAHVPQSIFLADVSIAENIALGVAAADIDMDRVRRVAHQARIADVIESRPAGYGARIGEDGVKLSGGQRQRIAIARALYRNASVLVLDEATSALDNDTEKEVMDAIQDLDPDLTIIIVAHRIASVKVCNRVVRIEGGTVVADGTFEQVLAGVNVP